MMRLDIKPLCRFILAAAALLVLLGAGGTLSPSQLELFEQFGVTPPRTPKPAPDFTLETLSGKTVSLKEFHGKPVLIHFWATWCKPCKDELPTLQKLYEDLGGKEIQILTINIDRWNKDRVEEFKNEFGLHFPILLDPGQEVRRKYFIMGLPTSYLVGADGTLQGYVSGAREWNTPLAHRIMESLAGNAS